MIGTYKVRKKIERHILGKSGAIARTLRGNVPFFEVWRNSLIDVTRSHGLGDVLIATPSLRELKRLNPRTYIRFYTKYPSLVKGLPYIDEVLTMDECPPDAIRLLCEDSLPTNFHLSQIMGDCLGIELQNTIPDCIVREDFLNHFRKKWGNDFAIVVSISTSGCAPNKEWPISYWNELLDRISQKVRVILVGDNKDNEKISSQFVDDLRGKTTLEELVAIIASGDLYIGPMSGPYHIAAGTHRPSMVILSGYEDPKNACYPGSLVFYNKLPCSPCWLNNNCPHSKLCLTSISVDSVEKKILEFISQNKSAFKNDDYFNKNRILNVI